MVADQFPGQWELCIRLLLSVALAAVVGFERELSDHPAGVRTHMAVALGSTLFGLTSVFGFGFLDVDDRNSTIYHVDPTRVASTIITGIGFLGAGAIVKHGASVRGLTTAGSLWVVCAIGLACALGQYILSIATTVVLLASLAAERPIRGLLRRWTRDSCSVRATVGSRRDAGGIAVAIAEARELDLVSLRVDDDGDEVVVEVLVRHRADVDPTVVATRVLAQVPGVGTVEVS